MNYNKLGKILIIQSTYDHNNAFDKDGDAALISIFKNFKFDLQLEFTQDIWEIFNIISKIEDKSIVHLIIKAHGESNSICIGPNNNKLKSNSNILLALCNLIKQKITSECSILLHSCLVGAEPTDKDFDNVATFFAQCLPGHIIFGSERSIKRGDLLATELLPDYDNNVLLVDYEIDMDANYNMYKFIKRKDIMKKIDKKKDIDIKEDLYNVLLPYMNKENQLGVAGKDGVTYKAEINGKNYAIKTFKKNKSTKKIEKEVEYQLLAADAGISPKVLNVNLKKKYIVMELMNELLIDYMKRKGLKKLELKHEKQLVKCMEILDNIGILHNDGNIRNIMLDNNNEIKIIDFGFSKLIKKTHKKIRSVKSPNGYLTLKMLKRSLKHNGFETGDIIDKFISTSENKI